jgi:enoyl-CoA hydratase/carnithine racemase
MRAKPFRAFIDNSRAVVRGLSECPKPIVAAVQGFALGGGFELALACDLIFAAQNARFGMPEGRLGLVPGGGGTARLPRLIGRLRANDLIMAGRILTADEALSWGLVSRVCAKEELAAAARAAAHSALDHSPESLAVAKRLVAAAGEGPLEGDLAREAELSAPLIDTPNAREGIAAFAAKRPPDFH